VRFRRSSKLLPPPAAADLEAARAVIERSGRAISHLALLGDKRLLFDGDRTAFVMFGVRGKSWVALGDPVGPVGSVPAMVSAFREICRRHRARPAFYHVEETNLPLYLDMGLSVYKIGEEALLPLGSFSPAGGAHQKFRQLAHRFEREGIRFRLVAPAEVPPLLPALRAVSDSWLRRKHGREKGFSLGYFREDYLARFPVALVLKEGRVAAFTNVRLGAGRSELSGDLLRYDPAMTAPGIIDYLFWRLILWGKEEGYAFFNLGMAPLAGLRKRGVSPPLPSPFWNRFGTFLFHFGEHFYHFRGLRAFKEKYHPIWVPQYLACPGGLRLPRVLADLTALISRGFKGILLK